MDEGPAQLVETAFRRISEGPMADLPILNHALQVETVGFRRWQNYWVGVLITPWFMNALAVPVATEQDGLAGESSVLHLPAGDIEFMPAHEETIGHYLAASLFSPMAQFSTQSSAVEVAQHALESLFAPAAKEAAEGAQADPTPIMERPLSRRGFLAALLPDSPNT